MANSCVQPNHVSSDDDVLCVPQKSIRKEGKTFFQHGEGQSCLERDMTVENVNPSLTLKALILVSLPRLDWQEFHKI
jgi:hypothetical protein